MNSKTKKLVLSAVLAALVCVVTMTVKIPYYQGYLNLGDSLVLLCGMLLSPMYAFCAAAIGSALADLFFGYVAYAPVTFLIKGLMALCVFCCTKRFDKKYGILLGGVLAECLMVLGYFAFECLIYGVSAAVVGVPMNAIQGTVGLVLGIVLIQVFKKHHIKG